MLLNESDRKLRVFFSVDVVGSTAYKTKHSKIADDKYWARFFESFFAEFPSNLDARIQEAKDQNERQLDIPLEPLDFWKMTGDEILYTAVVRNSAHVYILTKAFYRAVYSYDKDIFDKWGLRVKGTGWTAGFPLRNSEIKIHEGSEDEATDFIGPDIDIGFRISKASRSGRMVASMDLADLLAQHSDIDNFLFFHVGFEDLQGVFDNNPYPIFWIKEKDDNPRLLPWETFKCPLTKVYSISNNGENPANLRRSIQEIREALPQLELFPPYFEERDMPAIHRRIWQELKESDQKDNVLLDASALGDGGV